jgi:hypothetical protein
MNTSRDTKIGQRVLAKLVLTSAATMLSLTYSTSAQTVQSAGNGASDANHFRVANRARLFPRAGFASRLVGGKFQGSNENATSGFVDLATIRKNPAEGKWLEVTFSNKTAYRCLRFFAPQESWANVAELEFYNGKIKVAGTPYGTFGSRDNNGNTFEKVFDGNTITFFDAAAPNSQYVGIEVAGFASTTSTSVGAMPVAADGNARRHYHIGNSLTDTIGEYMQAIAKSAGYVDDFFDRQTIPVRRCTSIGRQPAASAHLIVKLS